MRGKSSKKDILEGNTFHPENFANSYRSKEDVQGIKDAFDLFDTDLGGSIDTKCKSGLIQN